MTNIITVDKDQYKGAEVAALINAELENVKASLFEEDLREMTDWSVAYTVVMHIETKTNDDFLRDLAYRYCCEIYIKKIVAFLRG